MDMDEHLRDYRLRWFDHVERRDAENMTKRIAKLVVEGETRRGRPKKSWKELVKEDLRERNIRC